MAGHQGGVHRVDLHEAHAHKHRVDVEMINTHGKGEVVRALNDHEAEGIPTQRIRSTQCEASHFGWRHLAVLDRDHLDVGGFADGPPSDPSAILVLKPTVVRVVPTKVRVDDMRHDTDVAPTGYVPGGGEQP